MTKKQLLKIDKILIIMLILIQPFVDMIKTNIVNDIQIFGFSLFEAINIGLVMVASIIAFICNSQKKKFYKYIIFIILFCIYFALHCYNMTLFNNNVYPEQTSSFIVEFYYIYRTFINPLILLLLLYYIKMDKEYLIKIIKIFSLIISIVIIVSNIFHFGYQTYGEGFCKLSIFDWFTFENVTRNSYYMLTSRGLFSSGNQLSSIMFMLLPIILYSVYKHRKKSDYIALIFHILAMYILGTKVSTLGVVAILIAFFLMYVLFIILNKIHLLNVKLKDIKLILLISVCAFILFFFSPRSNELFGEYNLDTSSIANIEATFEEETEGGEKKNKFLKAWKPIQKLDCYNMDQKNEKKFITFFNKYKDFMGVSEFIIKAYVVEEHPEFWCDYLQNYKTNDYRILKTGILRNIYNENNNNLDKYLGMGYNLNFIYTESDYSYQFYNYGLLGILVLIGPYFLIIAYIVFMILKSYKKKLNFENLLLLMAPALALCVAYYSGHVLERTLPLLMLATVCGINLINITEGKNE